MIEISKNIPVPDSKVKRQYPYKSMDVGDSFYVEGVSLQVICNGNYRYGKKLGAKFIAKKENAGVRVWRTT